MGCVWIQVFFKPALDKLTFPMPSAAVSVPISGPKNHLYLSSDSGHCLNSSLSITDSNRVPKFKVAPSQLPGARVLLQQHQPCTWVVVLSCWVMRIKLTASACIILTGDHKQPHGLSS